MKNYPFVNCLHPKKIVNLYTDEPLLIPCGRCEACCNRKSSSRALKCRLESQSNKYCYFVTLTYSSSYIPLAEAVKMDSGEYSIVSVDDRLCNHGEILCTVDSSDLDIKSIIRKVNCGGYIPYLSVLDVQLFIKRLRKKITNEKIRLYYSGEYGPKHFRPHYHLLLWFNEPWTAANIQLLVRQAWPFGRVDCERAKDASQYVASYVNGSCYLPKIYKTGKCKPFSNHSYFLGEKILLSAAKEVYEMPVKDFVSRSVCINGVVTDVNLWRSCITSFFPKCRRFGTLSRDELLFSYGCFRFAKEIYGISSPYRLAIFIVDEIVSSVPFDGSTYEFNVVSERTRYFHEWLVTYCDINVHDVSYDSLQRYYRTLYNVLSVSRLFLTLSKENFDSCDDVLLDRIISFYKDLDYMRLTDLYASLEAISPEMADSDYVFLYNNTPFDETELYASSIFLRYSLDEMTRFSRSVKHKLQNDANLIFNNL